MVRKHFEPDCQFAPPRDASRLLRVQIDAIDPDGHGTGLVAGRRRSIPGVVPGDEAEVVAGPRGEARLVALRAASPDRIAVDCPWHGPCGGCPLIALSPAASTLAKEALVRSWVDSLVGTSRLARAGAPPVRPEPFCGAPASTGYRHRCRLHQSRDQRRPSAGFLPAEGSGVVPIDHCRLLHPQLDRRLSAARVAVARLPFAVDEVRLAVSPDRPEVGAAHVVVSPGCSPRRAGRHLEEWLRNPGFAGVTVAARGRPVEVALGHPTLTGAIAPMPDGRGFCFEASHFTQGNAVMNRRLIEIVLGFSAIEDGMRVVELFAGAGNFTLPLARAGARVIAVESDPAAVRMAHRNVRAAGLRDRIDLVSGQAFETAVTGDPCDVLLIDPPRVGMPGIERVVTRLGARGLVYVSCDLPSWRRDAERLLAAGFALVRVVGLDLYPRSRHVELVSRFERVSG